MKDENILKEVTKWSKEDFPQFWNEETPVCKESRENIIETYYSVRMKTEELCSASNLIGSVRQMHIFSNRYYAKAEFKMLLMNQEIELLKCKNKDLESRIAQLEPSKTRKKINSSIKN